MFCPNCGNAEDVMQDSLNTFCNACDTRFVVIPKMEMPNAIENLQVTELRLITDRKSYDGETILPPFYSFLTPFEDPPIFFTLDISELTSFETDEVEIEDLDKGGILLQTVLVWKRDGKIYMDNGEYARYLRVSM